MQRVVPCLVLPSTMSRTHFCSNMIKGHQQSVQSLIERCYVRT